MNELFTQLSERYNLNDPYERSIFATEFGAHNGTYETNFSWDNSLFLTYAHAKHHHHMLDLQDWTQVVERQLEMHFHNLSRLDIETLISLVPQHRTPWFQYMQSHYPNYTFNQIHPAEALNSKMLKEPISSAMLEKFLYTPEQDMHYFSDATRLAIFNHIEYTMSSLHMFPPLHDQVLEKIFNSATFPSYFQKKKKRVIDLQLLAHCPIEMKPKRDSWIFPLKTKNAITMFQRFPHYLQACSLKYQANPFRSIYQESLKAYAQHIPEEFFVSWLSSQSNLILQPWLWLPMDVLPDEFQKLRTDFHMTDSVDIHTMVMDYAPDIVEYYRSIYDEHQIGQHLHHLYSTHTISEIQRLLIYAINLTGKYTPSRHQWSQIESTFTMSIPPEWLNHLFYKTPTFAPEETTIML